MTDPVLLAREGDLATVTLNNPDRLNALTRPMWTRLGEIMRELSADEALRCIVLRGAGEKAFASGADISEFSTHRTNVEVARGYGELMVGTMESIGACRHPTIALIRGVCVGGGLELAAMCDLRIAGASSRFGIPIKRLGLVMGYGELQGLLALVRPTTALEILLEGRVFGADEALQKGLLNRVVPDDRVEEEVLATARRIAEGAPLVARWHKKFVRRLAHPTPLSAEEHDESYACFGTEDYQIGYRSFLEKNPPQFKGR